MTAIFPPRPMPASRPALVAAGHKPAAANGVKPAAGADAIAECAAQARPGGVGAAMRASDAGARALGAGNVGALALSASDGVARTRVPSDAGARTLRAGDAGRVHSWELVTAVDGPGTRLTVFLARCPLRCLYCHNPDTMAARNGTMTDVTEVAARMARYAPALQASGGGVTISGGEPLQQSAFTARLLREAKRLGLHTALDTSGFLGAKASDELLDDVDLVLLDIKSGLSGTYRETTGRELAPTIAFGDRLSQRGVPAWVRFVLVPGLTDAPENVAAVARIVSVWGNVERVEVLPFHQLGEAKWRESGLEYRLAGRRTPTAGEIERTCAIFADHGLTVRHG